MTATPAREGPERCRLASLRAVHRRALANPRPGDDDDDDQQAPPIGDPPDDDWDEDDWDDDVGGDEDDDDENPIELARRACA